MLSLGKARISLLPCLTTRVPPTTTLSARVKARTCRYLHFQNRLFTPCQATNAVDGREDFINKDCICWAFLFSRSDLETKSFSLLRLILPQLVNSGVYFHIIYETLKVVADRKPRPISDYAGEHVENLNHVTNGAEVTLNKYGRQA